MVIISKLLSFLYNHQRKFIISGLAVGGSVAAYQFASYKLRKLQEQGIQDMLEAVRRQRYFETVQDTCDQTIIDFDKAFRKTLTEICEIDELIKRLKSSPSNKVEIWNELKIANFTNLILLICMETFLVALLRIQLGIIGGFAYKEKITDTKKLKRTAQEIYLSLFTKFTKTGLKKLYQFVKTQVATILLNVNLEDDISIQKLRGLFWSMQTSILRDGSNLFSELKLCFDIVHLLDASSDSLLKEICLDTVDILYNNETVAEINSCISCGFIYYVDQINEYYPKGETKAALRSCQSSLCFAKLIPVIYNTSLIGSSDVPSVWLRHVMSSEKFKILCANVYEAYC